MIVLSDQVNKYRENQYCIIHRIEIYLVKNWGLVPGDQKEESSIHWINLYSVDNTI